MWLSFIFALIPIIWLIVSLGVLRMAASKACSAGLVITIFLAILWFKLPVVDSLTGALEGIIMGLWPICYVILAALFTYNLTMQSGSMQVIQDILSKITTDERILVLIIAWGFGGFLEAIAGFGTAVAIPAGILIAFGVEPIKAAVICLAANTTPTAFGAIGLPVITLANVTGQAVKPLSVIVTLQLMPLIILIPFLLVAIVGGGLKVLKGVGLTTLVSGLAFGIPQIVMAQFVGAELPAIAGALVCIVATILMAKVQGKKDAEILAQILEHSGKEKLVAVSPFILVFMLVILASSLVPPINQALSKVVTNITVYTGKNPNTNSINWLSSPGTLIIIATFIGGLIQGMKVTEIWQVFATTAKQIVQTVITVCSIVGLAKVMGYAGMTQTLATTLVVIMGPLYPLLAPMIGALGTFITGSDTSSNVLFGNLQVQAATSLKANTTWLVGANMSGATIGKMISPQSIAVASAAIKEEGNEGEILKQSLKLCLSYLVIICLYVYFVNLFI